MGGGHKWENEQLLRELLSKAREGRPAIFSQNRAKRLEFSNISLCLYGGHKSMINDIFFNDNTT